MRLCSDWWDENFTLIFIIVIKADLFVLTIIIILVITTIDRLVMVGYVCLGSPGRSITAGKVVQVINHF